MIFMAFYFSITVSHFIIRSLEIFCLGKYFYNWLHNPFMFFQEMKEKRQEFQRWSKGMKAKLKIAREGWY